MKRKPVQRFLDNYGRGPLQRFGVDAGVGSAKTVAVVIEAAGQPGAAFEDGGADESGGGIPGAPQQRRQSLRSFRQGPVVVTDAVAGRIKVR